MKIEKIKKTGKKYKIVFEDKSNLSTFDDVILNNNLLFNKEVDSELLNKIVTDNNYYDVYYKVVNYITKKLRSEKEIINYMDKLVTNEEDKIKIINRLKEFGLINDVNFVRAYINDHIYLSNDGPNKIKVHLLTHDIDVNIVNEYIENINETYLLEKIKKLIIKKTKSSSYAGFKLKQKVISELLLLGFDYDMINLVYDDVTIISNIENEYNSLFKKLSIKYSGNELENKIKQKLYQKGYTTAEINKKS